MILRDTKNHPNPMGENDGNVFPEPRPYHSGILRGIKDVQYAISNESVIVPYSSDWVCTAVMSNDVMKDLRG